MLADVFPGISTADLELGLFAITVCLFLITVWLTYLTKQNVNVAKSSANDTKKLVDLTNQNVRAANDSVEATKDNVNAVYELVDLTTQNVEAAKDIVDATNTLIEFQTEPLVHVEATWNRRQFYEGTASFKDVPLVIWIKNIGRGPARDVDFAKMKDDFSIENGDTTFKQAPLVKEGITELAPTQKMSLAWLSIPTSLEINRLVKIEFEYKNQAGTLKPGSNNIDFPTIVHSLAG